MVGYGYFLELPNTPFSSVFKKRTNSVVLVCNHVTRRPCWGSKQKNIFSKNLHENRVWFPEERNAFVLDHQHGRHDVTCKPAIKLNSPTDLTPTRLSDTEQSVNVTNLIPHKT